MGLRMGFFYVGLFMGFLVVPWYGYWRDSFGEFRVEV